MTAHPLPPMGPPVDTIAEAIARMEAIATALPPSDGLACFNRMYLAVTRQVDTQVGSGFFADAAFMTCLDVVFANIYLDAVNALTTTPQHLPTAWAPLLTIRGDAGIEPIQFALAGMNAHINHDLPLALVTACSRLATAPEDGTHRADYQKVDQLLDAADQAIRQSFESGLLLDADRHVVAVANVIGNWSINEARDVAWDTSLALWALRHAPRAKGLLLGALAHTVGMVSRSLMVVV